MTKNSTDLVDLFLLIYLHVCCNELTPIFAQSEFYKTQICFEVRCYIQGSQQVLKPGKSGEFYYFFPDWGKAGNLIQNDQKSGKSLEFHLPKSLRTLFLLILKFIKIQNNSLFSNMSNIVWKIAILVWKKSGKSPEFHLPKSLRTLYIIIEQKHGCTCSSSQVS